MDYINSNLVSQCMTIAALGFGSGVVIPFAFRIIGYIIDSARKFTG